jgi:hypothetical protein
MSTRNGIDVPFALGGLGNSPESTALKVKDKLNKMRYLDGFHAFHISAIGPLVCELLIYQQTKEAVKQTNDFNPLPSF